MEPGEQTGTQAPARIMVRIGNAEVDFTEVPPITGGDRKKLFQQGVDLRKFATEVGLDPVEESKVVLYFVQKIHPGATEVEVDDIPTKIQESIFLQFVRSSQAVKNPFLSPSSISSPTSTAGTKTG